MESIFNWIERPAPEVHKPPMYKSRHAPKVPPTGSTFGLQGSTALPGANLGEVNDGLHVAAKHGSRTFGRAEAKTSPERFLRKGERMPSSVHDAPTAEPVKPFRRGPERRRPAVPKRAEKPLMGLRSDKNFVLANAVETILAEPKRVDHSPKRYTTKEDYGKVPAYLSQVKHEVERENEVIRTMYEERTGTGQRMGEAQPTVLSAEEREELLRALKAKWDDVNRKYQRITHNTKLDTLGKINRKEALESELDQIERDINMLSSKRPIAVVDEEL